MTTDRGSPFLLSVAPGLEDVAASEVRAALPGSEPTSGPYGRPGLVRVEAPGAAPLLRLRTVEHVLEIRGEGEADTLDAVRSFVAGLAFDELKHAASFRVTSHLHGDHAFDRRQLQGAAGAQLQRKYGTPVDLAGFERDVHVDLFGRRIVAGFRLTRESLASRVKRGKALRSSLKPTIAAAMLRLAGAHDGNGRLADPMCGSGVIPVEALETNSRLVVTASDWDPPTVDVARSTLALHGFSREIVRVADARSVGRTDPGAFDFIVTDPPYGMRQGRRAPLGRLYGELLSAFRRALRPGGRIAVIVVKHRTFAAAVERSGLRVRHELPVESGSIRPHIVVLEP